MDLMQDTLTVQMSSKTEWCIWSTCTTRPSGCILGDILMFISWVSTGRHRTTRNHMNHLAHQRPNGLPTRIPTDKGAPIYDIRKIVGFFNPLPPFPHMEPIYTLKFMRPPLQRPIFHDPPPPRVQMSNMDAPQGLALESMAPGWQHYYGVQETGNGLINSIEESLEYKSHIGDLSDEDSESSWRIHCTNECRVAIQ